MHQGVGSEMGKHGNKGDKFLGTVNEVPETPYKKYVLFSSKIEKNDTEFFQLYTNDTWFDCFPHNVFAIE